MWHSIAILLIAAPGAPSDGASAFLSNRDDQAIGREGALSPAAIEDRSVAEAPWATSDSGLNQGYDPTATQYGGFSASSGDGGAPCSLSAGPCIFNSIWDVT